MNHFAVRAIGCHSVVMAGSGGRWNAPVVVCYCVSSAIGDFVFTF